MGLIYLDTCLVIYAVEGHPRWGASVLRAIAEIPEAQFCISPLVKCECLVAPIRRGDPVMRQAYDVAFTQFVSVEMPEGVYLLAAELRGRFALRTPDALHLACAQHHRCDALWTNDDRLTGASHGMARNVFRGERTRSST